MEKEIKITYNGSNKKIVPTGTILKQISDNYSSDFDYDILIAKVNNDIMELGDTLTKSCNIEFYDRRSTLGHCVYAASANFILILATRNVLGRNARIIINHSLDNGVFCQIEGTNITRSIVKRIEDEMKRIVDEDYRFEKFSVSRTDAMKYFKIHDQIDKVNVLKYISNTYINLYRLDDLFDYFYGKLAYSTGQINDFKLTYIKGNGLVLSIPTLVNPAYTLDYVHHEKIYQTFANLEMVSNSLGVIHASDLNRVVSNAMTTELILNSEAYYDTQLQKTADDIIKRGGIRLVLLAGPSSSGKTTTSKKLMTYLKARGMSVVQISVDNYFVDRDKSPIGEDGKYDLESLYAVDLKLFNEHLKALMNGEEIEMPTYNFVTGKREFKGNYVKLNPDDIMVVEGIHCLNDELTQSINKEYKYKIYISPLVNLNIDDHNHIHTTDIRKLRRIVRDSRTRGKGALTTLNMWSSIRKGEENNIYPYQDEADQVINSSLIYEIGVLKTYVEPLLFCVDESEEVYPEALRLINFLRNFLPIPGDSVPIDSVLREFIGGSCFKD